MSSLLKMMKYKKKHLGLIIDVEKEQFLKEKNINKKKTKEEVNIISFRIYFIS